MDYSVVWSCVNNPTHTYPIVFIIKLKLPRPSNLSSKSYNMKMADKALYSRGFSLCIDAHGVMAIQGEARAGRKEEASGRRDGLSAFSRPGMQVVVIH